MSKAPELAADDEPDRGPDQDAESEVDIERVVEESADQPNEVNEAEVELTEDDLGGDLFDGVETSEESAGVEDESDDELGAGR